MGTLGAPSVQGSQLSQPRELWPSRVSSGLWQLWSERLQAGPSLLPAPSPVKAVTGQPLSGAFHSPGLTRGDRGATAMAPPSASDSAGGPASLAARVSCSGISHCHLLPHEPSGISPQSTADLTPGSLQDPCAPAPSPAPPRGRASLHPSPGNVWLRQGLSP